MFHFISFLSFTVHKTNESKQLVTLAFDSTEGPNSYKICKRPEGVREMVLRIERKEGLKHIYSKDR